MTPWDPILTPGGRPRFREEEISTIGSMIEKWEQMEKEEGGEEQQSKDGRRSSGRRVSELMEKFEERGVPIKDGGIGGNHILKPGGGSSCSERQSKFKFSSPGLSNKSSS